MLETLNYDFKQKKLLVWVPRLKRVSISSKNVKASYFSNYPRIPYQKERICSTGDMSQVRDSTSCSITPSPPNIVCEHARLIHEIHVENRRIWQSIIRGWTACCSTILHVSYLSSIRLFPRRKIIRCSYSVGLL